LEIKKDRCLKKTKRGLYVKGETLSLSRSKVALFLECPRSFYLDLIVGLRRPGIPAFTLNLAVDQLLKTELDHYREIQQTHPLAAERQLNLVPFSHPDLDSWRDSLHKGIAYKDDRYNFLLRGGIDDVWIDRDTNELVVVDYKATSKKEIVGLYNVYKKQMEFYQWLFRKNGYKVKDQCYFIYCNGLKQGHFNDSLKFDTNLIEYVGNTEWIEPTIQQIYDLLNQDIVPEVNMECPHCEFSYYNIESDSMLSQYDGVA